MEWGSSFKEDRGSSLLTTTSYNHARQPLDRVTRITALSYLSSNKTISSSGISVKNPSRRVRSASRLSIVLATFFDMTSASDKELRDARESAASSTRIFEEWGS